VKVHMRRCFAPGHILHSLRGRESRLQLWRKSGRQDWAPIGFESQTNLSNKLRNHTRWRTNVRFPPFADISPSLPSPRVTQPPRI
jgi:hypothetical protein